MITIITAIIAAFWWLNDFTTIQCCAIFFCTFISDSIISQF